MISVQNLRQSVAVLAIVLLVSPAAWACDDIAVVSHDGARFLVLDGDSLRIKDVGNLWWLGVRSVAEVMPGSTLPLSIVRTTEDVVEPGTGSTLGQDWRLGGYFVLRDLESVSTLRDPSLISRMPIPQSELGLNIERISDGETDFLVHRSRVGEEYAIALRDPALNVLRYWPAPDPTLLAGGACIGSDGTVFVGGLDSRAAFVQDDVLVEPLDGTARDGGYRLTEIFLGCRALITKRNATDDSLMDRGIIDIEENRLLSEFTSYRYVNAVLFADGSRLLEQARLVVPVANTQGTTREATSNFRVVDTSNGNVILQAAPDIVASDVHEQLLCRGESERVAIPAPGVIYLMDLASLAIVAAQDLPFERYFVLGD